MIVRRVLRPDPAASCAPLRPPCGCATAWSVCLEQLEVRDQPARPDAPSMKRPRPMWSNCADIGGDHRSHLWSGMFRRPPAPKRRRAGARQQRRPRTACGEGIGSLVEAEKCSAQPQLGPAELDRPAATCSSPDRRRAPARRRRRSSPSVRRRSDARNDTSSSTRSITSAAAARRYSRSPELTAPRCPQWRRSASPGERRSVTPSVAISATVCLISDDFRLGQDARGSRRA